MGVKVREKDKDSGVWWVFVHHKGERTSNRVGSKKAAMNLAQELEEKIGKGKFSIEVEKTIPTFKEYSDRWLNGYVASNLKDSSHRGYVGLLNNHILPAFGRKKLDEITRQHVKELCFKKMREGLSSRSVKYIATTISAIFNHAIEDNLINFNPALKPGKFIKLDSRTDKIDFLTPDEVDLLLESAREHFPKLYPLLLTALRTGMRQGELLGLKWDDIDFNGKFIEVKRGWDSFGKKFTTPKNGKTRRVDMSDMLIETLRGWRKVLSEIELRSGIRSELVFPSDAETPIDNSNLNKIYKKCLKKAGLRNIRFHDLRHTYASLLINLGESLAYIKDQLGHHSIQITVDTYGHLIPGSNRAAVNKLDNLGKTAPYTHPHTKKGLSETPKPLKSLVGHQGLEPRTN